MARDAETDKILADRGWIVLRFWEHEDSSVAADKVRAAVGRAG
ncbi:hypothetical protein ACFS27_05040 [Promicromonospora vindobonensis]|uniref:DUF559 domain-containing protein n=1 Tax=Promicromonospora vindobonensis TaxID=195748 RepID=A0ABW5VSE6_9MICO